MWKSSNGSSSDGSSNDDNRNRSDSSIGGFSPRSDFINLLADKVLAAIQENADAPIQKALDDHLPTDAEGVRNLPFFDNTMEALRYQRDNYLVGSKYAKRSEKQRQGRLFPSPRLFPRMPREATALGHVQITDLGRWFIPSSTIKESLMPIVVALPSTTLRESITTSVANAIPLAQPSLDSAVKNAILDFIDSPEMRQMVKNRTEKILQVNDKS